MGRPAHLREPSDLSGLTSPPRLKNRKAVPLRLAAAAVAIAAFLLVPAAQAGSRSAFQAQLARALHARHVSPARRARSSSTCRPATLFAHNPAGAQPRFEREARDDVRGPDRARPLVPDRERRARRRAAERSDVAGEPRAEGIRRSRAVRRPAELARAPGRCGGITHVSGRILGDESWFDARRTGLGWKPHFYLHESPALSALIVNRGWTGRYETRRPALMAAQLFRRDLRRAGVAVDGGAAVGVASERRFSSGRSSRHRSPRSCATWTFTATTSTPRCC